MKPPRHYPTSKDPGWSLPLLAVSPLLFGLCFVLYKNLSPDTPPMPKPPASQAVLTLTEQPDGNVRVDCRFYLLANVPRPTGRIGRITRSLLEALTDVFPANAVTTDPPELSRSIPLGPDGEILSTDDARILDLARAREDADSLPPDIPATRH